MSRTKDREWLKALIGSNITSTGTLLGMTSAKELARIVRDLGDRLEYIRNGEG